MIEKSKKSSRKFKNYKNYYIIKNYKKNIQIKT